MTTSKGTIQGYNGVASVDKKHQIIIDAQAFGEGQEYHVLQPVLETIQERYQRLNIHHNLYESGIQVTADTGYANESNMKYLHEHNINAYIPDNQFRSRDPKFINQKKKYGQHPSQAKKKSPQLYSPKAFTLNNKTKQCTCPAGNKMRLKKEGQSEEGHDKLFFESKITDCRKCKQRTECMRTPNSADRADGQGRQVSFILNKNQTKTKHTDWMKQRIDSQQGKQIYSHRMSVVEPVFANMASNKRLNRFTLRGKSKVQGQWQLYCLVHNIEKLKNYGQLSH